MANTDDPMFYTKQLYTYTAAPIDYNMIVKFLMKEKIKGRKDDSEILLYIEKEAKVPCQDDKDINN